MIVSINQLFYVKAYLVCFSNNVIECIITIFGSSKSRESVDVTLFSFLRNYIGNW